MIKKRTGLTIIVVFLLIGLAIAPNVNADIVKSSFRDNLVGNLKSRDLKGIEEIDWIKLPILYILVQLVINHRYKRLDRVWEIAVDVYIGFHGIPYIDIIHPLLFLWSLWLLLGLEYWIMFSKDFSNKLNLDWPIYYPWVD